MNRCFSCKNNRRQLLMLKCSHDICIRCASDNFFINCKNKLNPKTSRINNYFCETCLEQTELDSKTAELLKKYFLDNIQIDEKHKNNRKDKLQQRQQTEKQRAARLQKLGPDPSHRPKSLQAELEERKHTLSKYLSDKQVSKFMEMQKQYGHSKKINGRLSQQEQFFTLGQHQRLTSNSNAPQVNPNQYQLNPKDYQTQPKKQYNHRQKYSDSDSFDRFANQQKLHNDYMRVQEGQYQKQKNMHLYNSGPAKKANEAQYQLYHNGKAVVNYNSKLANCILQEDMPISRHSSNSSARVIGTIKSKRAPVNSQQKPGQDNLSIAQTEKRLEQMSGSRRKQRLISCKSQENVDNPISNQVFQNKAVSIEFNHKKNIESSMEWEIQSKSTRKNIQEKTVPHGQKNNSQGMEKILETLMNSQQKQLPQKIKERSVVEQQSRTKMSIQKDKVETYYCKIHEDQQIIYFCLRCNQLICSECALHGSHKMHEIHSLKKSAQLLRQNLIHSMNTLNKMLIEQQTKEKVLKQCINEIGAECQKQKQKIKCSFQNFIFNIDKKYKEVLKEVEDRYNSTLNDYAEKLNQSRNNYIQVSRVKDDVTETLQQCGTEEPSISETSVGAAYNQFGNFHIKKLKNKPNQNFSGIEYINKLICRIKDLNCFLKNSNAPLFSNKKQSLLSEQSSLKLSQSSNLLEDACDRESFIAPTTPTTNTPHRSPMETPNRRSKRIVVGGYGYTLNVKNRIRIVQCESIVESLIQMQEIVRAVKLDMIEYQVKALC